MVQYTFNRIEQVQLQTRLTKLNDLDALGKHQTNKSLI